MCLVPNLITRIQIHPAYDLWMRSSEATLLGARFGTVERYSRDGKLAFVRLDKIPNKLLKFPVDDLEFI